MIDLLIGGAVSFFGVASLVAAGAVGYRQGKEAGFDEGWREALIEDDTMDAEWEERAVMLPPPARKRLRH